MLFVGITGGVGAGKSEILSYLRTKYNSKVMLTDEIAHDVMEPGTACYDQLKKIFEDVQVEVSDHDSDSGEPNVPQSVYNADGTFNRQNLARVIFADDTKREALNGIVHPAVKQYVIDQYQAEKAKAEKVITKKAEEEEYQKKTAEEACQRQSADELYSGRPEDALWESECERPIDLLVVESALLIDDNYGAICDEMWYIYTTEENRSMRLKASRGYSDEKIQSIFDSQLSEPEFREACKEVIDNNQTPEEAFSQIREILKKREIYEI